MKRYMVVFAIFVLLVAAYLILAPRTVHIKTEPRTNEVISNVSPDSPAAITDKPKTNSNNPDQPTRLVISVSR